MSERGMDNWKDLQLFWNEFWMMKYIHGLDIRYALPKRASIESVKEFLGKSWMDNQNGRVCVRMTNRVV